VSEGVLLPAHNATEQEAKTSAKHVMALGIQNVHAAKNMQISLIKNSEYAQHAQESFLYFAKPAMVQVLNNLLKRLYYGIRITRIRQL
jgi:hypothetical protein